jgi:SAM-dependent methyltransferase
MEEQELRFGFGENWQSFVRTAVSESRVRAAVAGLQRLLNTEDLTGKSFLDIGCGSGLSSLSALLLGATRVVAFDYDPNSVQASLALRARSDIPAERWEIMRGSVLDREFLTTLPPSDVVYSWGVLHHTGAMWQAIDNAVGKVKPGGILSIAIYNNVEQRLGGSKMWWHIKRTYNRAPTPVRRAMEYAWIAKFVLRQVATLRNPVAAIRDYSTTAGRGMDFFHDLRDWLGGFPYEYATAGELFNHLHGKFGLQLEYLNTHDGHGCNELTLRRME